MIASPQLLPLSIKYAQKLSRIHLAEKLNELLPQFEQQEREKEKHFSNVALEAVQLLQNSPMGATMLLGPKSKASTTTPLVTPVSLKLKKCFVVFIIKINFRNHCR